MGYTFGAVGPGAYFRRREYRHMATTGPKSTRKAAPKKAVKKSVKKAAKKTTVKKTAAKKTVKAASTRQAGARRKAAPTKTAPAKTAAGRRAAPAAVDRHSMIAEAAYYRAERSGFTGDPMEHWLAAEAEIDLGRGG